MGDHSMLDAAGPLARLIENQWWIFVAVSVVVYVLVIAFLVFALLRRRRVAQANPERLRDAEHRAVVLVGIAMALTVITLVGLASIDFVSARTFMQSPQDPLRITITGHQWWWEVEYPDPAPYKSFRTANELRIPVGRPVELSLTSRDVIHSFWVPNLQGKRDLIPGRTTRLVLTADRAAVFGGQCAEFCGHQHAYMRITLHALEPHEFQAWADRERASARPPATEQEIRGQAVFLGSTCVMCHSIQGTSASATVAPDLTHLGNRDTIAAGALPNTPRNLAKWISDPQSIKPGTLMPATQLTADDLDAMVAYLASLR